MQILATPGAERDKAVAAMADASGSSVESFENQLKTTHFYKPKEAADYVASKQFHDGFTKIQQFSFKHGLLPVMALNQQILLASIFRVL